MCLNLVFKPTGEKKDVYLDSGDSFIASSTKLSSNSLYQVFKFNFNAEDPLMFVLNCIKLE